MMKLISNGSAGTVESGDILVEIAENIENTGISIDLNSNVLALFGRQIKKVITETLTGYGIQNAKVSATDKGALDCTIKARVTAALFRACDTTEMDWQ